VVSMLASGTQDRGFEPGRSRRIFGPKISQHAFLRRGSKTACPMSQIFDFYVEVGIPPTLTEVSYVAWRGAPLEMTGGTKRRITKGLQLIGLGATGW
jgi:hypothetical protein